MARVSQIWRCLESLSIVLSSDFEATGFYVSLNNCGSHELHLLFMVEQIVFVFIVFSCRRAVIWCVGLS